MAFLEKRALTVLKRDRLQIGPQILSWEPIELNFEAVSKQIAATPVVL